MPIDDVPPATVASPQVRDAWLARIRELAADGNIEEARASLREFQHRYPDYPLPQDLRALLP
jgi:TolA-binding protein